jgi:thioredoxin-related protein
MKIFLIGLSLFFAASTFAQQDTSIPPFKRYPSVPGLQLLTTDSTAYTNDSIPKNKPVMLMLFSPDCDHCQHEAEQIAANKDSFTNTHIILVSTFPIHRLKEFAEKYRLTSMNNVVMTKDPFYLLISFYAVRNLPYLALYNKKGALIETFAGSVGIEKIIATLKGAH